MENRDFLHHNTWIISVVKEVNDKYGENLLRGIPVQVHGSSIFHEQSYPNVSARDVAFTAIRQYLLLRGESFIAKLLKPAFHVFQHLGLGIDYLCGFGYEIFEVRIYSAQFINCVIVEFIPSCMEKLNGIITIW